MQFKFRINVVGVIHTINAFLPLLKAGSTKRVIVLSSGVGDTDFTLSSGDSFQAPYSISKAAVNMVVAKYAAEYRSDGFIFLADQCWYCARPYHSLRKALPQGAPCPPPLWLLS